jgi:membrane protein YdbS with pleckstrin-like domain
MNDYPIQIKKGIYARIIGSLVFWIFWLSIGILISYAVSKENSIGYGLLTIIGIIGLVFIFTWLNLVSEYFIKYSLDSKQLTYMSGILSKSEKTIPYSKIQHIIIIEDFGQRLFGIMTMYISTAREMSTQNNANSIQIGPIIPDLNREDAYALQKILVNEMNKSRKSGI